MTLPPVSASSSHRSRPSLEIHWKKAALAWDRRASSIDTELGEFIGDDVKEDWSLKYRDEDGGGDDDDNNNNNKKYGMDNDHGSIKSDITGGGGEETVLPQKKKRVLKRGSVSVVTPFKGSRVLI